MAKIKLSEDVQPLTTFRNNSAKMIEQLRKKKRALVLTVNGKPAAVVQSVAEYERFLDLEEAEDIRQAILEGEEDIKHGRTTPLEDVMRDIRKKYRHAG